MRHLGPSAALMANDGVGVGVVEDDVDAARALGRGAVEVDRELFVFDGDGDGDADRLVEAVAPGLVLVTCHREARRWRLRIAPSEREMISSASGSIESSENSRHELEAGCARRPRWTTVCA